MPYITAACCIYRFVQNDKLYRLINQSMYVCRTGRYRLLGLRCWERVPQKLRNAVLLSLALWQCGVAWRPQRKHFLGANQTKKNKQQPKNQKRTGEVGGGDWPGRKTGATRAIPWTLDHLSANDGNIPGKHEAIWRQQNCSPLVSGQPVGANYDNERRQNYRTNEVSWRVHRRRRNRKTPGSKQKKEKVCACMRSLLSSSVNIFQREIHNHQSSVSATPHQHHQ